MRKLRSRLQRHARAAGPGEAGRAGDGYEERRRIGGLGISRRPPRKGDLHGDSGIRPRRAGSPPGVERRIFFESAPWNVPRRRAAPARQARGYHGVRRPRRRGVVLALPAGKSHVLQRALRPVGGDGQDHPAARGNPLPGPEHVNGSMNATLFRAVLLLLCAAFTSGCAGFSAVNPGASARQLETLVGAPASVWKNADGSEVWEYPRGPLGVETYMVTLGPDGAVREVRQVLSDETISKLHDGMSRDQVRRLLGRPRDIGCSTLNDEEIWSWRYREWGVRNMELYVQFDRPTGSLKKISRFQVDTSDGKRQ